jgi:hypothetical protein
MTLTEYMVNSCVYAQEHFSDADLTPTKLGFAMEITSYQIACFLAQNTKLGSGGVEWDIVHAQLCGSTKSEAEWKQIIDDLVMKLGGFGGV